MKQRPIAWFCCDTATLHPFFAYRPLKTDNVTGRTYLESGKPVRVLIRGNAAGPRNVLIGRAGHVFCDPSAAYGKYRQMTDNRPIAC